MNTEQHIQCAHQRSGTAGYDSGCLDPRYSGMDHQVRNLLCSSKISRVIISMTDRPRFFNLIIKLVKLHCTLGMAVILFRDHVAFHKKKLRKSLALEHFV